MKSISNGDSFSFQYISVVEVSDSSSNSSDIYVKTDSDETDDSAIYIKDEAEEANDSLPVAIGSYLAKENQPIIDALGGGRGGTAGGIGGGKLRQSYNKTSEEYHRRRERNNLAVRKSRNKAKQKQRESLHRLQELTAENKRLQMKAELLMKELIVLKGLFPTIGETPPLEVDQFLAE